MKRLTSLRSLALKHGTDKAGHHEYCEAYEFFLEQWRDSVFSMLEIGIGGYEYPDKGGESLRMWFDYFPSARIYALDLYAKNITQPRTAIFQGSQDDEGVLDTIFNAMQNKPRLIIDDASHVNLLTIKTFQLTFERLAPGGIYVVEDAHTSYWMDNYGGGVHTPVTAMEYFKLQADYLNHEYWAGLNKDVYELHPRVQGIESIHFFREIIFIRKKY